MEAFILIFILTVLYFLPFLIGYNKKNAVAIFTLNFFLGWTLIGWVVALVWAVSKDKEDVIVYKTESTSTVVQQIKDLKKLYDEGVITQSEFEQQKHKLLK